MQIQDGYRPAIEALAARIGDVPSVDEVWLYGSRGRGDHQPRSYIDLAVRTPRTGEIEWSRVCDIVEDADTLLPIDLVRLEEASDSLRTAILDQGVRLYVRRA